jgi:hypothetical protein
MWMTSDHDYAQVDLGDARRRDVNPCPFQAQNGSEGRIGLDRMIDLRAGSV